MKRLLITALLVVSCLFANAQFSISAKYGINSFPEWEEIVNDANFAPEDFIGDGLEYGFSYWFRLKNYRVEFMPELSYQGLNSDVTRTAANNFTNFSNQSYFFTFNTLVYTLDIEGDCNCPTWGKDGSFIQKGFFVGVSPGIGYHTLKSEKLLSENDVVMTTEVNKLAFRVGVSTGLDIGISEWVTITPYATLNYTPSITWDNFENIVTNNKPGDISAQIWQIQPGLRLTFRPDYLKEQRGMFR